MVKINKDDIEIIRKYFLCFDKGIRNQMRHTLSGTLFDIINISVIEGGFIEGESVANIASKLSISDSSAGEIEKIRNEYYISLAQLYLEGESNDDLVEIVWCQNPIFKKLLNDMSDDKSFEKDMQSAFISLHRDEMKRLFQKLDEEDEFELSDKEIKAAITSVEREAMIKRFKELDKIEERGRIFKLITRYAIAACLVGIIAGGSYLLLFTTKTDRFNKLAVKDSINNRPGLAKIETTAYIEHAESKRLVLTDQSGSGFAGNVKNKYSVIIKQNGLSSQIDYYRKQLDSVTEKRIITVGPGANSINIQISRQIDSLMKILNTYTYHEREKMVELNISRISVVKNIISIEPSDMSFFYINIAGKYYLIKASETPVKLIPVTDNKTIEALQRIEFSNE